MMSIVLLQAATDTDIVEGPIVRIPAGNYKIEKSGHFENCMMFINDAPPIIVNAKIILSNHSNIRVVAHEPKNLTVRFIKEN